MGGPIAGKVEGSLLLSTRGLLHGIVSAGIWGVELLGAVRARGVSFGSVTLSNVADSEELSAMFAYSW